MDPAVPWSLTWPSVGSRRCLSPPAAIDAATFRVTCQDLPENHGDEWKFIGNSWEIHGKFTGNS